jgi:hypothetical protein
VTPPLEPLVGMWSLVARHTLMPDVEVTGRAEFEWVPGGHFLTMRSRAEHPQFPDSLSVIGDDAMHYFDSRGVFRVYSSAVRDGLWTLRREAADPFWQRFSAPLDGDVIEARWDRSEDEGATWQLDLSVTYKRAR